MVSWCWYGRCLYHLQAGWIEEYQLGCAACPHWHVSCLFHAYLLHGLDLNVGYFVDIHAINLIPDSGIGRSDFSFISLLLCHSRNVLNRPRTGSERLIRAAPYWCMLHLLLDEEAWMTGNMKVLVIGHLNLARLWVEPILILLPGGGFKYCLFSPLFGEDFQFD